MVAADPDPDDRSTASDERRPHRTSVPSPCPGRPPQGRRGSVSMVAVTRRPSGGLVLFAVLTLAALIVFIALGTWQLERKAWKEALIETLDERLTATPMA